MGEKHFREAKFVYTDDSVTVSFVLYMLFPPFRPLGLSHEEVISFLSGAPKGVFGTSVLAMQVAQATASVQKLGKIKWEIPEEHEGDTTANDLFAIGAAKKRRFNTAVFIIVRTPLFVLDVNDDEAAINELTGS